MSGKWCCTMVLLSAAAVGYCAESEFVTLETVRLLVARNEALLNPIKMAYTVKKSQTGERPQPTVGSRRGRRYSHVNCVWMQAGDKHYARVDRFYGPNEPANSTVKVIEPERVTEGILPDLMKGTISPGDDHDWYSVLVAKLGLRPFEGHYTLSQILVPEYASLHKKIEIINGRETYVVDAKRPSVYPYFARIWIDQQRGLPLRIRYFDRHPDWEDTKSRSEITDITHHPLPNGGWVPIEGVRSIDFSKWISYEHIIVDVNSITTRNEDIPETLFEIDFPKGAGIYDVTSGLVTVKGRPLKTYEQVISTGGSTISGVVVDEKGAPVPGVVVGPCVVKVKQSDGRLRHKLIQGHDRPCTMTDVKGRFAIELEEEGMYDLLFFPGEFVDTRVRDVPLGRHDVKVELSKGGTVTGRVVRLIKGEKVPVTNVKVEAKEGSRLTLAFIRRHRLSTTTDENGRFQIKYLETLLPKRRTEDSEPPQDVPRAWQIRCGSMSETVLFEDGKNTQDVEFVLKPDLREAVPLIGRLLPDFEGINIDLPADHAKDKLILICFFDLNQRPSRNYLMQLDKQAESLEQKGVGLAAIQAVKMDESVLDKWISENKIPFPIGMIQGDEECVRFDWAVCSLPWLIFTDKQFVVVAEGFGIDELESKIRKIEFEKR